MWCIWLWLYTERQVQWGLMFINTFMTWAWDGCIGIMRMRDIVNSSRGGNKPMITIRPQTQIREGPWTRCGRQEWFKYSKEFGLFYITSAKHNSNYWWQTDDCQITVNDERKNQSFFFQIHCDLAGSVRCAGTQAAVGRDWKLLIPSGGELMVLSRHQMAAGGFCFGGRMPPMHGNCRENGNLRFRSSCGFIYEYLSWNEPSSSKKGIVSIKPQVLMGSL